MTSGIKAQFQNGMIGAKICSLMTHIRCDLCITRDSNYLN